MDLAPVVSAEHCSPEAILHALPIPSKAPPNADPGAGYLRDKQMLLVLDNSSSSSGRSGRPADDAAEECWPPPEGQAAGDLAGAAERAREWLAPLEGLEVPGDVAHECRGSRYEALEREAHEAMRMNLACFAFGNSRRFATSRSSPPPSNATAPPRSSSLACAACAPDFRPTGR